MDPLSSYGIQIRVFILTVLWYQEHLLYENSKITLISVILQIYII